MGDGILMIIPHDRRALAELMSGYVVDYGIKSAILRPRMDVPELLQEGPRDTQMIQENDGEKKRTVSNCSFWHKMRTKYLKK